MGTQREDTNILEFNQHQKFDKRPYVIYTDLESLIKRIDGYNNNPKKIYNKYR